MAFNPLWKLTGRIPTTPEGTIRLTGQFAFSASITKLVHSMRSQDGVRPLLLVARDLLRGVIRKSPVLTGQSRASWYFGLDSINTLLGSGAGANRSLASAEALGYTQGRFTSTSIGDKKSIRIASTTEYIRRLEFGWSTKAPWGMVRVTIEEMKGTLPQFIKDDLISRMEASGFLNFTTWRGGRYGYKGIRRSKEHGPMPSMAAPMHLE